MPPLNKTMRFGLPTCLLKALILPKKIEKQNKRKDNYQKLEKQLKQTGEKQISTSDPDSRHMITRNNITKVTYNIQDREVIF